MVTRDDVARRARTSTAVVSYVVNDGPRPVSPQTRARVEQAIEELGYQPNRLARALRTSSTNVLGVGLGACVYLWTAHTAAVSKLCDLSDTNDTISSLSWVQKVRDFL